MADKDHIIDYDTTAGNNTDVDGVPIAEGVSPGNMNDAMRELMSDLAEFHGDITGLLAAAGSGGDFTLTTNDGAAAYAAGQLYAFIANHSVTGACTLDVNTIGAKGIKKNHDLAIQSGDIETDQIVVVAYKATEDVFQLISPTARAHIAQGVHTIWIPAAAMTPTVTAGCGGLSSAETTAGRPDMIALPFDTASDEHAQFQIAMPTSWNEGTVTFIPYWTFATGSAAETVSWFLQGVAASNDDTVDVAYGTAVTSADTAIAAEDLHIGPESAAITIGGTPAAGDCCFFRLYRDVSADDLAGDALLVGIKLMITIDTPDDA